MNQIANSKYIVKETNPKIFFEYDSQTDLKNLLKYSKILKELDVQQRKWQYPQGWVFEKVKIVVSFKKNQPIIFSLQGSEKKFPDPYYVSNNIHHKNKDELDRTRCYEVKKEDVKILRLFFEISPSIKGCMFERIWFHEFPIFICSSPNIDGFNFYSCRIDKFPNNFKDMFNLETIHMKFSWVKMPNSFANCKNLRKINFEEACLIDKFPDDIGNCLKLQKLIYAESYMDIPAQARKKIGITSLPPSIGKIPNLTKIKLTGCVNLRSLPEEIAFFPLKSIILDNCMIRDEQKFLKTVGKNVLINWYNLGASYFDNTGEIKFDFDLIIERLSPVFECLETNVFEMLIWKFPKKKKLIIRILEQWTEKTSNLEIKRKFQDFVSNFSPKIEIPKGKLFL